MHLTVKQKLFCAAYVRCGNVSQAAMDAGYNLDYARSRAYELLDHLGVKMHIAELQRLTETHGMAFMDVAETGPGTVPEMRRKCQEVLRAILTTKKEDLIDENGEFIMPAKGSMAWHAIQEVRQETRKDGSIKTTVKLVNIKTADKLAALRELGEPTDATAEDCGL